jgi:hypothetical protein
MIFFSRFLSLSELIDAVARVVLYIIIGLADAALGEGRGVKLNKLSVKEIKAVRHSFFCRARISGCFSSF